MDDGFDGLNKLSSCCRDDELAMTLRSPHKFSDAQWSRRTLDVVYIRHLLEVKYWPDDGTF